MKMKKNKKMKMKNKVVTGNKSGHGIGLTTLAKLSKTQ